MKLQLTTYNLDHTYLRILAICEPSLPLNFNIPASYPWCSITGFFYDGQRQYLKNYLHR